MAEGGRLVLVVDDEAAIRTLVNEFLTEEGYQVMTATNGRAALETLASWRPNVILLDLMMPEMDGWTFLARQQADPQLVEIPVIVMSAKHNFTGHAKQLATTAVLAKPFDIEQMLALVKGLIC